ncbi:hypothetical protein M0811_04754 [Anaeramoeba ignava]|uniref:TLDc domain-containing protein n=1 Tax=Anaeramoeba ignava TaxID=1746090 RepID=A0A9Q0RFS5_ANAIG|nr:hypothetical protein M0811_04754 [Anaeramoeba ignava]
MKRKLKEEIKRIKEKDKKIKSFESENQNLKQENVKKEKENEKKEKKIKSFESENQNLKQEIQKKEKENQNLKSENENQKQENEKKDKILKQKDEEIQNIKLLFEKENQKEESKQNQNELLKILPQFSDSEIIKEKGYVKKLKQWINDNNFFSKMKKGFSAKRDGFNSKNWHKAVDNKGKTLIIIKTTEDFIFGGFTQVGWTNDKSKWREDNYDWGYIIDSNAFIFSLRNDKGDRKPEKFTIKQGEEEYAIEYDLDYGPSFGYDIWIDSDLQSGESNFGQSYNLPNGIKYDTNEAKSYLAGSFNEWVVDELETYFI